MWNCSDIKSYYRMDKFKECGELLRGRRFSLRMKRMFYRSCVKSAMLYGSETWCLRESEMAILRRSERGMMRSMCGLKLVDRKKMEEMLGLKETLDGMAKAKGVRWYGHVIRRDDESLVEDRGSCRSNEMEGGVRAIARGWGVFGHLWERGKNRIEIGYN